MTLIVAHSSVELRNTIAIMREFLKFVNLSFGTFEFRFIKNRQDLRDQSPESRVGRSVRGAGRSVRGAGRSVRGAGRSVRGAGRSVLCYYQCGDVALSHLLIVDFTYYVLVQWRGKGVAAYI